MGLRIQRPFIAAAVQRLFGLTGRIQLQLEPFVLSTVQLADLSLGSEPPVRRHAAAQFTQGAVALERTVFRLEVPPSIVAVITNLSCRPGAAATSLNMAPTSTISSADLGGVAARAFTEGRLQFPDLQGPAASLVFGTRVAALAGPVWFKVVNPVPDRSDFTPVGWIVGSGIPDQFGFMEFAVNALNDQMVVNMEWDEYQVV